MNGNGSVTLEGTPALPGPGDDVPSVPLQPSERLTSPRSQASWEHAPVSAIIQSPAFREELSALIQEQMGKGSSSSRLWALPQIVDFLSTYGHTSAIPAMPSSMATATPINDLQGADPCTMGKGEGLQRCKLASVYRLLDLYGWAQMSHACLTLRVSKEQDHFLVLPNGLSYSEATARSLVKVNILGEVVDQGSTPLGVDVGSFSLHAAIHAARPDVRCLLHLRTPATAAVSAMKCGLLPLSHEALLVGEVAYYSYSGCVEEDSDRTELQKALGPTCKVLVLRNHGIMALGESVEEAFFIIYHLQAACQIQVSAMCSAGSEKNLILLDRATNRPHPAGTVGWAGSTFGPMHKNRRGEHEFEALMRTLDNLGYRTGYAYRFPLLLERSRARQADAAATACGFEWGAEQWHLRRAPHSQRQRLEKVRWLNTPDGHQKAEPNQDSPWRQRSTWPRTEEMKQGRGSGIKTEKPNQFVPLFTNPQEVLETRKKIWEQSRLDVKRAGPQSHVLAAVLSDVGLDQGSDLDLIQSEGPKGPEGDAAEPEPPNPFSQLTDQELEEYRQEVQRKQRSGLGESQLLNDMLASPTVSLAKSPICAAPGETDGTKVTEALQATAHGGSEEKQKEEEEQCFETRMKALTVEETMSPSPTGPPANAPSTPPGHAQEQDPPLKKKKKFRTPSFLKRSKKQDVKVEG